MTDLQEKAMRMALERLESHEYWMDKDAIQALRQALAQPGQGYALIHKDVLRAWGKLDEIESACCYPVSKEKEIAGLALAQPSQEPYGWISNEDGWFRKHEIADLAFKADAIPLYTAPPKRECNECELLRKEIKQAYIDGVNNGIRAVTGRKIT